MTTPKIIHIAFQDKVGHLALDVAFDAPMKGVTALFGPSGSGKTTILRCIAGLHRAQSGVCAIGQDIWQSAGYFRPVHERPIGYVFQEPSLFPHLSIQKNLLFGAKDQLKADSQHFSEIVRLLGLDELLARMPGKLSGGERQRVAIGRALLSDPGLLLMDEPLSALDAVAKDEVMTCLERLQSSLEIPVIYVSHDINEVDRIADHLVMIENGHVVSSGPIAQLQNDPFLMLASRPHAAVSLNARVVAYEPEFKIARFAIDGGFLNAPSPRLGIGEKKRLKIFAGDVSLSRKAESNSTIENQIPVRILSIREIEPAQIIVFMMLGHEGAGERMLARITKKSFVTLGLDVGQSVYAQVKAVALAPQAL